MENKQNISGGSFSERPNMGQKDLLRRIQELSFAKLEVELFLDTHPKSRAALTYLDRLRADLSAAMKAYRDRGGELTTDDVQGESWRWVETPFPWEND